MPYNEPKYENTHRVAECPDCSQTDWPAIQEEIRGAMKNAYEELKMLTEEEWLHLDKFLETANVEEISLMVKVFTYNIQGAMEMANTVSNFGAMIGDALSAMGGGNFGGSVRFEGFSRPRKGTVD